jgi:hypothetical protein
VSFHSSARLSFTLLSSPVVSSPLLSSHLLSSHLISSHLDCLSFHSRLTQICTSSFHLKTWIQITNWIYMCMNGFIFNQREPVSK